MTQFSSPRTRRNLFAIIPIALAVALSLCLPCTATAGAKEAVNFSDYQMPLVAQVKQRIKEKVAARLGNGRNVNDRYFIIPFAYQNKGNDPEFSHSFMSVIRVLGDARQPKATSGIKRGTYKNYEFEAFTISWIPADFLENPNLCVFKGFGARLIPQWNKCPVSVGKNFTLEETLQIAAGAKVAVGMWGPYEITREGFESAVARLRLLNTGKIKYLADDRLTRKKQEAINCFHAMAGLEDLFPNGGLFGTGFNMWGINGTRRVLIEYDARAKHMLRESVDPKKDLYGFVYAPTRNQKGVFDPFNTASAYHE